MRRFIWAISLMVVTSLLLSCDSQELIASYHKEIAITSVTPSAATIGQETLFDVMVSYKLGSAYDSGIVYIGFNDSTPDCFRYVDQRTVSSGTGTLSFTSLSAIPTDWGTVGNFAVAAILDSNNRQVANAIQVISLTSGTL